VVGGMVVVAVGAGAAAVKLTQNDAQRIEQYAGAPVDELTDEELTGAMQDLGIQSAELTADDKAGLNSTPPVDDPVPPISAINLDVSETSYLDELEKLASLRDRGIITTDEFEAKKKQLLGL